MNISAASLALSFDSKITPAASAEDVTASAKIARSLSFAFPDARSLWRARIAFGAAAQTASINLVTGAITPSAAGTAQIETSTVIAAAGCIQNGNLPVTVTAVALGGGTITVQVSLTTAKHTTAALIAQAIRDKLVATPAVADLFRIGGTAAAVTLTSRYAKANEGGLNLAWTALLGVTAVVNSTHTTAGVVGVLLERVGGDAKNAFGEALPTDIGLIQALVLNNGSIAGNVTFTRNAINVFDTLSPGSVSVLANGAGLAGPCAYPLVVTAAGVTYLDVIAIGK